MSEQVSSSRRAMRGPTSKRDMEDFVDATKELKNACANLFPGQMVCNPDFTLMDSMAALQIMDPRMDSGIFPIPDHLIADGDKLPLNTATTSKFNPESRMTAEDVCWIMDRLVASEVAWHKGATLSQTLHTCLYVHSLSSIHPSAPQIPGEESNWLVSRVLRPFLIAILKSVGLVWDELARGNVVDGEDFNGDKAGVSLMEDVRPEEAIYLLEEADSYIRSARESSIDTSGAHSEEFSELQAASLSMRVNLRKNILFSIYSLSRVDPAVRGQDVKPTAVLLEVLPVLDEAQETLQAMRETGNQRIGLMSPCFADAPSVRATSAFDPWYSRRPAHINTYNAPSAPPPPLPLNLGTPMETLESYSKILTGMCRAVELATTKVGWTKWKNFLDSAAIQFQRAQTLPYVRSLWQSTICSNSVIALNWSLNFIAEAFVYDSTGVEYTNLAASMESTGGEGIISPSLKKRTAYFMERLAGHLVNHLCSLAQNRSRGKRRLAASYDALVELSEESAALDVSLMEALGMQVDFIKMSTLAIQTLTLDTMLQIVYSGFELELHRMEECSVAYWLGLRIAEEKLDVVMDTLQSIKKSGADARIAAHLESQVHYIQGLALASKGMQFLFRTPAYIRHSSLPWQPFDDDRRLLEENGKKKIDSSQMDPLEALHKVAFCKRFKWLNGRGRPEGRQTLDNLWADFKADLKIMEVKSTTERLEWARDSLNEAVNELKRVTAHEYNNYLHLLISSLEEISSACNSNSIIEQSNNVTLLPLKFAHTHSHPWFPVLYVAK